MNDEDFTIYNKGIIEGRKHASSSKDTKLALKTVNDKLKGIEEKLDKNDDCHADLKNKMQKLEISVVTLSADLAPIKKMMWYVLTALVGAFIVGVLSVMQK